MIVHFPFIQIRVGSSESQFGSGSSWGLSKIEGERGVIDLIFFNESVDIRSGSFHGDLREGHSEDSVEFGGNEGKSFKAGGFSEVHGDAGAGHGDDISADEAGYTSGTVLDVEFGTVFGVGGGGGGFVGLVEETGGGPTGFRGEPEVGGTGVENDLEGLGRGSDGDFSVVLGVEDVGNVFFGSSGIEVEEISVHGSVEVFNSLFAEGVGQSVFSGLMD